MFKPMLAPGDDPLKNPDYFSRLKYPLLCSPKLDGIRCIVKNNRCMSRTFKELPSIYVQKAFSAFSELDGEIIVGNETDYDVYNRTQSYVMSEDKPHNPYVLQFRVFDFADECCSEEPFDLRLQHANKLLDEYRNAFFMMDLSSSVSIVYHSLINNYEELINYENMILQQGYEGIMMRNPSGKYKHGRGTFKEGLIYKLKRFQDDEAEIIGFVEKKTNNNKLETNELGYAKRSSSMAGLVGADTLGRFIVDYKGMELDIAPGSFTHDELQKIWDTQNNFIGKILKFRFFGHGIKDKPRFPRAIGFRDIMDL